MEDLFSPSTILALSVVGIATIFLSISLLWRQDKLHLGRGGSKRRGLARAGKSFHVIRDQYTDLGQVQKALSKSGMPKCELIVCVDFSATNLRKGTRTFSGNSLHQVEDAVEAGREEEDGGYVHD